jgi:hypothetical protein
LQRGFGLMNIHGIAKPFYRTHARLHAQGPELRPSMASRRRSMRGWCATATAPP